jgi:hypothetical protein
MVNEELDPTLVIRRLKAEIKDLKEEIRILNGGEEERGPLTPDELARMRDTIVAYCQDPHPEAALSIGGTMMFIKAAFQIFKVWSVPTFLVESSSWESRCECPAFVAPLSEAFRRYFLPSDQPCSHISYHDSLS